MDEARQVAERLRRIEELRDAEAGAGQLIGELRALLSEGEAWLAAERAVVARTGADVGEDGRLLRRAGRSLASLEEELRRAAPGRPGCPSEPGVESPSAAAESDEARTTGARSKESDSRSAPIPSSAADSGEVVAETLAV
jgi:hypothetical protein